MLFRSDYFDAVKYAGQGDVGKASELILPKFMRSVVTASRYGTEGITTRKGNVAVEPDQFSAFDLVAQGLGFTPTLKSEHYEAQQSKEDISSAVNDRKSALIKKALRGEDISEERSKFNEDHPTMRLTMSDIMKARAAERRRVKGMDEAGVSFSKKEKSLQGVDRYAYR